MKKTGILLTFLLGTQMIGIVIAYQFYRAFVARLGGSGGSVLSKVHWIVWVVLIIEIIISIKFTFSKSSHV